MKKLITLLCLTFSQIFSNEIDESNGPGFPDIIKKPNTKNSLLSND